MILALHINQSPVHNDDNDVIKIISIMEFKSIYQYDKH